MVGYSQKSKFLGVEAPDGISGIFDLEHYDIIMALLLHYLMEFMLMEWGTEGLQTASFFE